MMDNIRKDKCAFYIKFIFYSYKLSLELWFAHSEGNRYTYHSGNHYIGSAGAWTHDLYNPLS